MKLTSMKRTKNNKTTDSVPELVAPDTDDYPYGLELRLEKAELSKLGIDIDDFSIGGKVNIECMAEVTNLSESANKNNSHSSASFQITHLAIEAMPNPKPKRLRDILDLVGAKMKKNRDWDV